MAPKKAIVPKKAVAPKGGDSRGMEKNALKKSAKAASAPRSRGTSDGYLARGNPTAADENIS
jgi:hypothetical protein